MGPDTVVKVKEKETIKAWGVCPECKKPGIIHDTFNQRICVCDKCRTFWNKSMVDEETWRDKLFASWLENEKNVQKYKRVVSYRPDW